MITEHRPLRIDTSWTGSSGVLDAVHTDSFSDLQVAVPLVKVCGITRPEDVEVMAEQRPDLIGMVLWEGSPRGVTDLGLAEAIAAQARELQIGTVGVFVNEQTGRVAEIAKVLDLSAVQLHGKETPGQVAMLVAHDLMVWKALRVGPMFDPGLATSYREAGAWAVLLDTYREGVPGGTGEHFDWMIAAELSVDLPVVLAGGLGPENVRSAVALVGPWAVDASSVLERAPGIKDPVKVREYIEAARAVRLDPDAQQTI